MIFSINLLPPSLLLYTPKDNTSAQRSMIWNQAFVPSFGRFELKEHINDIKCEQNQINLFHLNIVKYHIQIFQNWHIYIIAVLVLN